MTQPTSPSSAASAAAQSLPRLREQALSHEQDSFAVLPAPGLAERLRSLRADAYAAFEEQGIPSRKLERWKGTSLARFESMSFAGREDRTTAALPKDLAEIDADLVFIDGQLQPPTATRANLPAGARVLSLAEAASEIPDLPTQLLGQLADPKKDSLVALQTALFEDVAVVHLAKGTKLTRPIRLISYLSGRGALSGSGAPGAPAAGADTTSASAAFPRLLVVAETQSEGTLVFENATEASARGYTGFVAEYHVAAGAHFEAVELQSEGADCVHVTSAHAHVSRDAHFDSHVLSLGLGLVRSELSVTLAEPGCETKMRGFFLGRGDNHIDHFTTVDHAAEHCVSDEEYRGVLGDSSKGVFRGLVIVQPGAQKTDARQQNPNLILSDKATIDTKPQLEIYADDVRASHGSTIGQLDDDALFFLRARGIAESEARLLLTRAVAHGIVDELEDEALRNYVGNRVDTALASLEENNRQKSARNGGGA